MPDDPRKRYLRLVERVMGELAPVLKKLDPPVTTHTYFGAVSGGPDMTIWYAFADRVSRDRAVASGLDRRIREMTKSALSERGYPADAPLLLSFTCCEEFEVRGDYFGLFGEAGSKQSRND